jgi:FtsZ-interacting cell division protein ZipA
VIDMGSLAIVLGGLAIVVAVVLGLQWRRRRIAAAAEAAAPGNEAQRTRAATALSELRDMREALGPATHNRVERRRTPPPGSAPKIERRKKGGGRRGPEPE